MLKCLSLISQNVTILEEKVFKELIKIKQRFYGWSYFNMASVIISRGDTHGGKTIRRQRDKRVIYKAERPQNETNLPSP